MCNQNKPDPKVNVDILKKKKLFPKSWESVNGLEQGELNTSLICTHLRDRKHLLF